MRIGVALPGYFGQNHRDVKHGLEVVAIACPYCGEHVEVVVDCSIEFQEYVEDCSVCCRPIDISVSIDHEGEPSIEASREDD